PEAEMLGLVYMIEGAVQGQLLRVPEWIEGLERARAVGERVESPLLLATAGGSLGLALTVADQVERGQALMEHAWRFAAGHGLAFPADRARWCLTLAHCFKDPRQGLAWATQTPNFRTLPAVLEIPPLHLGILARLGEFEAGAEVLRELRRALGERGQPWFGLYPSEPGLFLLLRGDWDEAEHLLREGWAWCRESKGIAPAALTARVLGEARLAQGNLDAARDPLEWAADRCREGGCPDLLLETLLPLCRLFLRAGGIDRAAACLAEARRLARPELRGSMMGHVAIAECLLAAARGERGTAEQAFCRAVDVARRYGCRWDEANAYFQWGSALAEHAGWEAERSADLVNRALSMWEIMGAAAYAERCHERAGMPQPALSR
ncbi:MAG: hypothetical protein ACYDAG_14835, partial [Chloroflexota bacterium]